jgi:Arc/MetJ family transcription regulator
MTEITVHVDESELAEARELLGTQSLDDTVQAALRRAVADVKRKQAIRDELSPERQAAYAQLNDLPA